MDRTDLEKKTQENIRFIRASGSTSYPISEEKIFRRAHEEVSITNHFILLHYHLSDSGRIYLVYFPAEDLMSNAIN